MLGDLLIGQQPVFDDLAQLTQRVGVHKIINDGLCVGQDNFHSNHSTRIVA